MNPICRECVLEKKLNGYPQDADPEKIRIYQEGVRKILDTDDFADTGTDAAWQIDRLWESLFGPLPDFGPVKRYFNELMMKWVPVLEERLEKADDPLLLALQYAMTGNYIDFAALGSVDEGKLGDLLRQADQIPLDPEILRSFRNDLSKAKCLAFVADNCGEIVMDQVLMRQIRKLYPQVGICAIVRGGPVANDATMEDALQIALTEDVQVIGSGTDYPGMHLERCSAEAGNVLGEADVVIAKGQANFETLSGCGLNIYYAFMCKCELFTERFGVEIFSGVLTRERM